MQSKIIQEAENQIETTKAKLTQIRQARIKIIQQQAGADERLESLKSGLPSLLAARALNQATDGEITALKREIRDFEASVQEAKLTLQGLEEMEPLLENSMRIPRRILRKAEKYRLIRSDLENEKPAYRIADLQNLSEQLGFQSDYEIFIQEHPRLVA